MFSFQYNKQHSRLGVLLVKNGLITQTELNRAIGLQSGQPLGVILVKENLITQAQLKQYLRKQSFIRVYAFAIACCMLPFNFIAAKELPTPIATKQVNIDTKEKLSLLDKNAISNNDSLPNHFAAPLDPLEITWDAYDKLLDKYAIPGVMHDADVTKVDFRGLQKEPKLDEIIHQLAVFDLSQLTTKKQKLAFYINAYNLLSIKMVVDHWPLRRLKDLGSFFAPVWTHDAGILDGNKITLRHLEHEILRKLDEPRIHFAINCASISCPNLRIEAYRAHKIDEQLEDQTVTFLSQNKGVLIKQDKVYLSKIFKWFSEDFEKEGGVCGFIAKYLPEINAQTDIEDYLVYDWKVTADLTFQEKRIIARR